MAIIEPGVLEGVLPELIDLRHTIHSWPDLSGHEVATAKRLLDYLSPFSLNRCMKAWADVVWPWYLPVIRLAPRRFSPAKWMQYPLPIMGG